MKRIASLLLASCLSWQPNPAHYYKVVYADGWEVANQQQITTAVEIAANDWTTATNGFITFSFDGSDFDPHVPTITIKGEPRDQICGENDGCPIGITFFDGESSTIHIPYDLNDTNKLLLITQHEIGHANGLIHTGQNTIMHWNLNGMASSITCADVAQLCMAADEGLPDQKKDCDPTDMPVCQSIETVEAAMSTECIDAPCQGQ